MSKAAISVFIFGIYIFFVGLWTLTAQNVIMPILWLPVWEDHWVYIAWIFTLGLSYFYICSAKQENTDFFQLSVYGRIWFFSAIVVLIIFNIVPFMMLPIAVIDLAGALWTHFSLKKK